LIFDAENGTESAPLCEDEEDAINSVAYSPEGRQIAGGSDAGKVYVWDTETGETLAVMEGEGSTVRSVAYSPDGRYIASGSCDCTIRVWDGGSGGGFACDGGVQNFGHRTLCPRDVENGGDLATSWMENRIAGAIAYSPDGRRIAKGSSGGTISVRDARSGAKVSRLRGHAAAVRSVSFSPDGRLIASGSDDNTVRVWLAEGGDMAAMLRGYEGGVAYASTGWIEAAILRGHEGPVSEVAYTLDGRQIVSGSDDGTIRVWDARSGKCLEIIDGSGDVKAIAAGATKFPLRAIARLHETIIERADDGKPIAWFPVVLAHIVTHPSGRIWAGAAGKHPYIISIEGIGEPVARESFKTP
jgi:WD40 repeat protein